MPGVRFLSLLAVLTTTALASPASAQPERPRVGLVLSGGGARGLAHVGVLRALEAMRVPIDVVTGTSMGAVVGGLFAAGLSPDEIATAVDTLDWDALLSETPPRSALAFRPRAEERRTPIALEIGLGGEGAILPGGLLPGQQLGLFLRRHARPLAGIRDFDELPTPFAAVATDIERAERVVLRSGDLAEALRASMAIPVVFTPVRIEGRLLVDGGIVDNLPVELARRMGADVIVAVDVAPRLEEEPELRTLFGITDQLVTILGRQRIEESLADADVVVAPRLDDIGLFDFEESGAILERGAAAALEKAEDLERWTLSERAYDAWRRARTPSVGSASIDRVILEVPADVDPRRLRARIDLAAGDSLDVARLEEAARAIFALGAFERTGYRVDRGGAGTVVTLTGVPKPVGRDVLRFGLRLVTDSGGADLRTGIVTFTGTTAWTRSNLNARGAEARLEGRFGQTNAVLAELHQPVDWSGRWFVEPHAAIASVRQPLLEGGRVVAEYDVVRATGGIDVGVAIGRSAELRLGVLRGRVDAEVDPGPETLLPALEEDLGGLTGRVVVDRLDDADWPTSGVFGRLEGFLARPAFGSDRRYERLSFETKAFVTRGAVTGFVSARAAGDPDGALPAYEDPRLGGFLSLSGFGPEELRGDRVAVVRTGALARLTRVPPALHGVYAGGWIEAGDAWSEGGDADPRWAVTAALGAETILGPVWLAYGRGEGDRGRIYVVLGVPL